MAYGSFPYSENRGGRKGRTWWRGGKVQAVLAGLATPNQTGNMFGAFQAGLGGSLAARQAEAEQQAQSEQDLVKHDLEQRLYDLRVRDIAAQEEQARAATLRAQHEPAQDSGTTAMQNYNFLLQRLGPGHEQQAQDLAFGVIKPPDTGEADKHTAFRQNVEYLIGMGYSKQDAVALAQRLVPTITTGTIYDAITGKTLPTTGTRTPQLPQAGPQGPPIINPVPSHTRVAKPGGRPSAAQFDTR